MYKHTWSTFAEAENFNIICQQHPYLQEMLKDQACKFSWKQNIFNR